MKRARFRLEPVLELRRVQERAAALAAAEAVRAAADADARAVAAETAVAQAQVPHSLPAGAFLATLTRFRLAAEDAAAARALATASAEQAEVVRAQWTAAAQRTKGLERLKERHRAVLLSAERTAEERAVDDLVTGRAGRARAGRTPGTGEVPQA